MKAVKNALVAAFVVWLTYVTLGAMNFAFALAEGAMLTAVATAAVGTFIASGIGMMMSKGIEVGKGNFGIKTVIRGAANPRVMVYGETVIGGTLVYVKTSGTDNNSLHMIVALAGHEINAISEVRLNGEALTTTTSTISSTTVHTVTNANFTNTANDNTFGSGRLVRFTKHLGASNQTYDAYAAAQIGSAWTSDHRLRGIAYIYIQCIFDSEKFGGGIPQISAKVQGKKVYDPRTSTTVYSANPSLCIRDYLMDTQNGLGALSTEINDSSSTNGGFVTAANICDQDVDDVGENAEDRYTMNGFFTNEGAPSSILESMCSACAGKISYSNGKFNLFVGAALTPSLTITDDDILSSVEIATQPDTANLFNGVKGIYVDKNNKYQAADMPIHLSSTYLGYDTPSGGQTANFEKYMELQFPYTLSESTAQRLSRIGLKANRETITVSLTVNLKFYQLQVGDWVRVTNDRMSWTNKYFEVMALGFEAVQTGEGDDKFLAVQLVLKETANDVYAFDTANDYEGAIAVGGDQPTTGTTVSPPTDLDATANVVQGIIHFIKVVWVPAFAATIQSTEVYYKVLNALDNTQLLAATTTSTATQAFIHGVTAGVTYQVRARHKGSFGNYSAYTGWDSVTIGSGGVGIDDEDDILNSEVDVTATTFTTDSGVPNNNTTPDPNPEGSSYLRNDVTPNTLYISNGTSWILQGVNSNTLYTLPTFTSSTSAPDNATVPSPNPMGSTWLHTTPDPDVLYVANATDWVPQNVNSNTLYTLPTHTSGSGVPNNNTTPSPNPLNSTYFDTSTTPDTLYISDGADWQPAYDPDDIANSEISLSLSGTALTLTNGGGSAQTFSSTSVGLPNVPNVDMRNLDNVTGGTLAIARGGTNAANSNAWLNTRVETTNTGELKYDGTGAVAPNINTMPDAGNTKTYAGYAGTGLDSSGRAKVGIISGGVAVTVAEMKEAKLRTYSGLNTSGELTGALNSTAFPMRAMVTGANAAAVKSTISLENVANENRATILGGTLTGQINDGTTNFTASELLKVRAGFDGLDGTAVLKVANANAALKNATIAIDGTTGVISGIGTANIKVNNAKTTKTDVGLPNVANETRATILGGTLTGSINDGTTNFTAAEALKIRAGFDGLDGIALLKAANANTALRNATITVNTTTGILENIGTSSIKVNNGKITVASDGVLTGIGTSSIKVNNSKTDWDDVRANSSTNTRPADGSTNNGSTIDTSGNIASTIALNATMNIGTTNAAHKITVGSNITIDGDNERIIISDAT